MAGGAGNLKYPKTMSNLPFIYKRIARRGTCSVADIERAFPGSNGQREFREAQHRSGIGRSGIKSQARLVATGPLPLWASVEHLLTDLEALPEPSNTGLFPDELQVAFVAAEGPPPPARSSVFGLIAAALLDSDRPELTIELLDGRLICVSPLKLQKNGEHWYLLTTNSPVAIGNISNLRVTYHA